MKRNELSSIECVIEYCKNLSSPQVPLGLIKKFKKIVFDHYDQEGPGRDEDIKSEIYVYDKAVFAKDFFEDLGLDFFNVDGSDLYHSLKERSAGYKDAFRHTLKNFSNFGGPDVLYA